MKTPLSSAPDRFENALRAGPPPVRPSTGFVARMENGWRHTPREETSALAAGWRAVFGAWLAPALAVLAMGMVSWGLLRQPVLAPSPGLPPVEVAVATITPTPTETVLPLPKLSLHPRMKEGLAALQASVEQPYRSEGELLVRDATQALRFVAANFASPEMLAAARARGWLEAADEAEPAAVVPSVTEADASA